MRIHALESTGGLSYAEMGQYVSAADPSDKAGTNDPAAAAKDADGNPVSNGARNIWVTETSLSTALNTSFLAESTSLFGIVVAIALILAGIGFIILALGGALREAERPSDARSAVADEEERERHEPVGADEGDALRPARAAVREDQRGERRRPASAKISTCRNERASGSISHERSATAGMRKTATCAPDARAISAASLILPR